MNQNQIYRALILFLFSPIYILAYVIVEILVTPMRFFYTTKNIIMNESNKQN